MYHKPGSESSVEAGRSGGLQPCETETEYSRRQTDRPRTCHSPGSLIASCVTVNGPPTLHMHWSVGKSEVGFGVRVALRVGEGRVYQPVQSVVIKPSLA